MPPAHDYNKEKSWYHKILDYDDDDNHNRGKLDRWSGYAQKYKGQKVVEGERIPTLREVIRLVKRTNDKTHLFIEMRFFPLKANETKSREEISSVVAKIIKVMIIFKRISLVLRLGWVD